MADSVDTDTLSAVRARWAADTDTLPALLDREIAAGALKSPRDQPLTLPYARVDCDAVPGKSVHYVTGIRKDCRKVTLSVWGNHTQASAALKAMLALFNARMAGATALQYPSGARFIKWWPLNDGAIIQEPVETGRKAGEDVWRATVEAEVYSTRSET